MSLISKLVIPEDKGIVWLSIVKSKERIEFLASFGYDHEYLDKGYNMMAILYDLCYGIPNHMRLRNTDDDKHKDHFDITDQIDALMVPDDITSSTYRLLKE